MQAYRGRWAILRTMQIVPSVALNNYSTMRLGGMADFLAEVRNRDELKEVWNWAKEKNLPVIMVGGGSNIVWKDSGFQGLVMVNKLLGFQITEQPDGSRMVDIAAGEPWDSAVARTVTAGLTGIEALSLIPGTAGATPVQNVGAYGQDISQTLQLVEVFDAQTGEFTTLKPEDCGFGYRASKFQTEFRGRYFIVGIRLRLQYGNPEPPFYGAVQAYINANFEPDQPITPQVLRDAVITIRRSKLPDVETVANNGSFFGNPVVDEDKLQVLLKEHVDMPHWPLPEGGAKIPAAWLIEQCGFKDYHDEATGMATWPHQPLVLVNEHAQSTSDLLAFRQTLVDAVQAKFGIALKQEPELLP